MEDIALVNTLKRLRRIALSCQGLTKTRPFGTGREASLRALEHLGYIQIDTLSVVQRAHHHTLWTRIPDYQPDFLGELVRDRHAFEYWSHAASYLPMRDYRFGLPRMAAIRRGESGYANVDPKSMRHVLARIRIDGPLKARDFENTTKRKGTWWNWKPTKRALEQLFMQGDLMITAREGMEKVYDLTERVLPGDINDSDPTLEEFSDYLIRTSLRANGFTTVKQLAHLRRGNDLRNTLSAVLRQKVEAGTVVEILIDGMPPAFADREIFNANLARQAASVRLLSPFDNAVIHRDRIQSLFGFDYRLECYVPQKKRQFGYFCLPILFRDELVGRVDCKAHRRERKFEIIHLHLDDKLIDVEQFVPHFTKSVRRFAAFNDCDSIALSKISPRKRAGALRNAFK